MSTFWILLEQMELFVIYILAGVILVKAGCLTGRPYSLYQNLS